MRVLECRRVTKVYDAFKGAQAIKALNDISFKIEDGEFLGVMGPSGSGKTTLLNILAGIDKATAGEIFIDGKNILTMKKDDMAIFRRNHMGFIFQDFNLLDSLTVKENIGFPLTLDRIKPKIIEEKVNGLIEYLGLKKVENSYPYNISGGQKQRVAQARALIKDPKIILGDEPTGNLDSKSSTNIMESFKKINEERKSTIVMVTHDPFAASFCQRIIFIKDGIIKLEINSNGNRKEFFDKIIEAQLIIGG
ncbi:MULTISPECIES: ABC transporter ATP-binding protein [unclassified Bacillus (in: firmicutes)]|uniref:ABC transporter ATP-binding protein n=1 Tax=unclassified Bacillus (in: firmicutes) TaxID=185979 RepID=UPI0008E346C2|nr:MULTISPECIES: ABC transporter ATP-binding protein [unclassified Bacillus (in: firmicutes)]SFI08219.1 putative ABC transport system ATP-binding protein [Bacillus sp. 71mf]SFS77750.1 putative ABC transport system ATP-binding protein [Bacillus sp. 103mf]